MLEIRKEFSIPVDLKLNCSYAEFMKWLKEYPVQDTLNGNKLKLRIDDIGKFVILFEYDYEKNVQLPDNFTFTGDGFTFDVITTNPLHLTGYYQYLFNTKDHDQDGFSTPARNFLERVDMYFVNTISTHKQDENKDPLLVIKNQNDREIIRKIKAGQSPQFIAVDLKFSVGHVYNSLHKCREDYPELNIPVLRKTKNHIN